jgi:hypothetical protein
VHFYPASDLSTGIDHFLDAGDPRTHMASFYSHTGRSAIDPELMIRVLMLQRLVGEGVVELLRHKGAVIRSLSFQDTLDVLDVAELMKY